MEDWLNSLKKDIQKFHDTEFGKLSDTEMRRKEGSILGGLMNKGMSHSVETKTKWSNAKKGKKISTDVVEKSRKGIIQTKWEQTLARLSKQDILDAQSKHGNHQGNTMKELGISFHPYKKLCKYYDIELKKSIYEKSEWARENQSEKVNVYKYDKTKVDGLGEYIGTYYSISEAVRQLQIPKSKGHAVSVSNGKRTHTNGYVFRKTK